MLSGSCDIYSTESKSFVSMAFRDEEYFSPENQINRTVRDNEMDFRRIQNGKKVQPDYIVVFREDGSIANMDIAKRAQAEFMKGSGKRLPIIIVDEDKCLKAERAQIDEMIKNNSDGQNTQKIKQKIRNNRVRHEDFANDIDLDSLIEAVQQTENKQEKDTVTEGKCEEIFASVKPEERVSMMNMFNEIQRIAKNIKGDNVKEGIKR
jgi:hypothetical protein